VEDGMTYERAFERAKARTEAGVPSVVLRNARLPGGYATRSVPLSLPLTHVARGRHGNHRQGTKWSESHPPESWHYGRDQRDRLPAHMLKLDEHAVVNIRALYKSGAVTQRELADSHGVALTTINYAIHRRSWKDVC
jgi:hypothetical protein